MDALLQLLPPRLRPVVRRTAERIAREDNGWCRSLLGSSGAVLGPNVALTVAAIAPHLPIEDVRLLTRFSLWLYHLDDRMDEPSQDAEAVQRVRRDVARVLDGDAPAEDDKLLLTLATQLADLGARSPSAEITDALTLSLRLGVAAAVEHALLSRRVARREVAAPSVEEYLEVAVRHINYRSFALALVLLTGPPEPVAIERVQAALDHGCLAVRLANDLRSAARERAEGSLNALALRIHDLAPVLEQSVRQRIGQAVRTHDAHVAALPTGLGSTLRNSLRLSVAVYGLGDLR